MAYYVDHIASNGTVYYIVPSWDDLKKICYRFDLSFNQLAKAFPFMYFLKKQDGTFATISERHEVDYWGFVVTFEDEHNFYKKEQEPQNPIQIKQRIKQQVKKPTIQKPKLNEAQRKQKLQLWASRITNLEKISKPTFKQKQELNKLWKKFGEL